MAAVAPASVAPDRIDEFYNSDEEYVFAVAQALHEEYKAIIDAGLILQIDDAYLALTYEVMVPPKTLKDYRKWASVRIEALNHALKGLPEERTRYHVCWGSWNGPHAFDVELKDIVDLILKVRVGGYLLEMANPRHKHEWRVWESVKLPKGRKLIPGVISHATNVVEHPGLVAEYGWCGWQNLSAATMSWPARIVASPKDRLCSASTRQSCGQSRDRWWKGPGSPRSSSGRVVQRPECSTRRAPPDRIPADKCTARPSSDARGCPATACGPSGQIASGRKGCSVGRMMMLDRPLMRPCKFWCRKARISANCRPSIPTVRICSGWRSRCRLGPGA